MTFRKLVVILILFIFHNTLFAGGPWTLKKHHSYLQVSFSFIPATNELFTTGSNPFTLDRDINDQSIALYVEYGITDKFTLIGHIPYNMTSNSDELFPNHTSVSSTQGKLNGLGNIGLTGKYQFYNKSFVMAGELALSFPTAKQDLNTRLSTGYDTYGIQPGVSIGFSKNKFYGFSQVGYNYRTDLVDDIKFNIETGYNIYSGYQLKSGNKIFKDTYLILAINLLKSSESVNFNPDNYTYLYSDQQEYVAGTFKLSTNIARKMGINLHMTVFNLTGNYVQKSPSIGGSLYWKF